MEMNDSLDFRNIPQEIEQEIEQELETAKEKLAHQIESTESKIETAESKIETKIETTVEHQLNDRIKDELEDAEATLVVQAEKAVSQPWLRRYVRFGIAVQGVIYFVIGLLALEIAAGIDARTPDEKGALMEILQQPLGAILLSILVVGLLGYALWQIIQAILNPDNRELHGLEGLANRLNSLMGGVSAIGLAITAVQIISSARHPEAATVMWTSRFLDQPFGEWIVSLLGVGFLTTGFSYLYGAYTGAYIRNYESQAVNDQVEPWIVRLGRFGLVARSTVFITIGICLLRAAVESKADRAAGAGGALELLAESPLGSWLLGLVALGFMSYAVYMLVIAWYRRIPRGSELSYSIESRLESRA
jgi:ElaB/YqjD/DUF883 family membrane-anchored ribosome-binding protein